MSQGEKGFCEWVLLTGVHPSMSWGPWGLTLHPSGLQLWKKVAERGLQCRHKNPLVTKLTPSREEMEPTAAMAAVPSARPKVQALA